MKRLFLLLLLVKLSLVVPLSAMFRRNAPRVASSSGNLFRTSSHVSALGALMARKSYTSSQHSTTNSLSTFNTHLDTINKESTKHFDIDAQFTDLSNQKELNTESNKNLPKEFKSRAEYNDYRFARAFCCLSIGLIILHPVITALAITNII